MNKKESRASYARNLAAQMARIALRLQHCKPDRLQPLLVEADRCLARFKAVKGAKNVTPIEPAVQEDIAERMQSLGEVCRDTVAPLGYALLVFGIQPDGAGGRMNYVANVDTAGVVSSMREFIASYDGVAGSEPYNE